MSGIFFLVACTIALIKIYGISGEKQSRSMALSGSCNPPRLEKTDIVFKGFHPSMTDVDTGVVLNKRHAYYRALDTEQKNIFRERLEEFINDKTFIIKDDVGYKEMPILVSAAAIQLTFGLKDYLLPFYRYIRIYPAEYFADDSFKVLAGNVKGNTISIAWNHFLEGYDDYKDGCNVGLHEMSHALYFQKMEVDREYSYEFYTQYNKLLGECETAHNKEKSGITDLYTDYAVSSLQEFWAESVELFFERPVELERAYPQVFEEIKKLLRQDPMITSSPCIHIKKKPLQAAKDFLFG